MHDVNETNLYKMFRSQSIHHCMRTQNSPRCFYRMHYCDSYPYSNDTRQHLKRKVCVHVIIETENVKPMQTKYDLDKFATFCSLIKIVNQTRKRKHQTRVALIVLLSLFICDLRMFIPIAAQKQNAEETRAVNLKKLDCFAKLNLELN